MQIIAGMSFAFLLIALPVVHCWRRLRIFSSGIPVKATVKEFGYGGRNGHLVLTYTVDGVRYACTYGIGPGQQHHYRIGQTILLYCDPKKPQLFIHPDNRNTLLLGTVVWVSAVLIVSVAYFGNYFASLAG